MSAPLFQIRLYNADNSRWRPIPLKKVAGRVTFSKTRQYGFDRASLPLWGKPTEVSGLIQRRRIEFMAREKASDAWVRLYRGYIAKIDPAKGVPQQTTVTLWGIAWFIGKVPVYQRYAFPFGIDTATAHAAIVAKWIKTKPEYSSIDVLSIATGQPVDSIDAWRRRFSDVQQDLADLTAGGQVAGGDVNAESLDRLFFRPFGSSANPEHTVIVPSPRTGIRERLEDTTGIANILDLIGGNDRYPNLLAQAVNGNTSFEFPIVGGETVGDLLTNGDFESGGTGWSGSMSPKGAGGLEGNPFSGSGMAEGDSNGEYYQQTQNPPDAGAVTVGADHVVSVRAKRESTGGTAPTGRLSLQWLDSGGSNIGSAETLDVTVATGLVQDQFKQFTFTSRAPSGATGFTYRIETLTAGGEGFGILWDTATVYDASKVFQPAWEFNPYTGSAGVLGTRWDYPIDPFHGAYSLFVNVSADDNDHDDLHFLPAGRAAFPVGTNQSLRFRAWLKRYLGIANPKLYLELRWYRSAADATVLAPDLSLRIDHEEVAAGSLTDEWSPHDLVASAPDGAAFCMVTLLFRGDGPILIDALSVRDSASTAETTGDKFVEGSSYTRTFRADDLFDDLGDGSIEDQIHHSAENWGELTELVEQPSITTDADAESYAVAFFRSRALPLKNPTIELFGKPHEYWPGEYLRAIGAEGQDLLPDSLPILEVEGSWDGKLTLTLYTVTEKLDESRKVRALIRKAEREGSGGAGSGSFSGGGASGGASSTVGPFSYRGAYDSGETYNTDDLVDYLGNSYVARTDALTGTAPTDGASDANWQLIAKHGDQGDPGSPGLVWRGAWSSATAYIVGDVVSRNGSMYVAIDASINQDPATATAYWDQSVEKGDPGSGGGGTRGVIGVSATTTLTDTDLAWDWTEVFVAANGATITMPDPADCVGQTVTLANHTQTDSTPCAVAYQFSLNNYTTETRTAYIRKRGHSITLIAMELPASGPNPSLAAWVPVGEVHPRPFIRTVTGDETSQPYDEYLILDTSSNDINETLQPFATGYAAGRLKVKVVGGGTGYILPNGAAFDTLDGASSLAVASGSSVEIVPGDFEWTAF